MLRKSMGIINGIEFALSKQFERTIKIEVHENEIYWYLFPCDYSSVGDCSEFD